MNGAIVTEDVAAPEPTRVGLHIAHVPTVVLDACACGVVMSSPDAGMLKLARDGKEFPPIKCGCGRVLIAQRSLVVAAR